MTTICTPLTFDQTDITFDSVAVTWDMEEICVQAPAGGGWDVSSLYYEFEEWKEKRRLEKELEKQLQALRAVEKKKAVIQVKAVQETPPKGILANLHLLEAKEEKIERRIETIQFRIEELEVILQGLVAKKIMDDDEDDIEAMFL
jgi:hypothetical protein